MDNYVKLKPVWNTEQNRTEQQSHKMAIIQEPKLFLDKLHKIYLQFWTFAISVIKYRHSTSLS